MDDLVIARLIHVLAVVHWIGGVVMVTFVLLPAVRRQIEPERRVAQFEEIERRFAWQARGTTVLAGASGFWMTHRLDAWDRFLAPASFWWMHAMVAVWAIFTLVLFVFEPLFLHAWFIRRAHAEPERVFALVQRMHWLLATVSLVTVAGAVVGSHGGILF